MKYLIFHLVFTVPVFVLLSAAYLRNRVYADDYSPLGVAIVALIALVYTTPWDSYMIRKGVWEYGDGVVLARLWEVPLGEYFFFIIQPLISGAWMYLILERRSGRGAGDWTPRYALTATAIVVALAGWWWTRGTDTFYIGMILVWAGPVLGIQWAYGGHYLFHNLRTVAAAVVPPTLYLSSIDRYAIEQELWIISEEFTTGVKVLGLPVEEGAFFLVTCLLVVQGIMLFRWTLEDWRLWVKEYDTLTRLAELGP